ncbi:MAG TPA: hypothetical protein VIH57_24230 [Bacteroidales bacterium]
MKKHILLAAVSLIFLLNTAIGQDFNEVLRNSFDTFEKDSTLTGKFNANNKLVLIANKWNDQWITHYYAAYGYTILSFLEKNEDKKDAYLNEADKQLESAKTLLKKENDEWYVLAALVANARISVKPMSRWKKYGDIFDEDLAKAKSLQPDNPRIYYLEGMKFYHTPKMFGGGEKVALPYFEKADNLFTNESADSILKPFWGKMSNKGMLLKCREVVDNEKK